MADRSFSYVIAFDGDASALRSVLSGIRSETRSALADIQSQASKLDLFAKLEDQVAALSPALQKARNDVVVLTAAIETAKAAGSPTKELEAGLKTAQQQLTQTTREFNNAVTALSKLQNQLSRAGVDTKNLTVEQTRLAAAERAAAAAATEQAAKQALGLKTLSDIRPEVQRLYAAYNTLSVSGTLSVKELALAHQQLIKRVAEVRSEVTGLGTATKTADGAMSSFASGLVTKFVLPLATFAALTKAVTDVVTAGRDFTNRIAEIGATTNLTKEELAGLGEEVRAVATDLGLNLNEALRSTLELLRSGVPRENVVEVLRAAATASQAAFSDLASGVKIANLLLDNFGASEKDLPLLFDKIIRGAHDGGASFKEFADGAGPLLNVARAAGVSFDDLLATLTVLVNKSGNAEKSITDLTKIIAKLDTTDARNRLRDLGITGDSLVDIFTQIGERGLSLGDVLGIELTAGGSKSAASLAALTQNAKNLSPELEKIKNAGGEAAKGVKEFLDSPEGRSKRFSAALTEAETKIGQTVGSGSRLAQIGTSVIEFFNKLSAVQADGTVKGTIYDNVLSRQIATLLGMEPAATAAAKGIDTVTAASKESAAALEASRIAAKKAADDLKDFGEKLATDLQALQAASARDIADAAARADAQIAALDRSKAAEAATAAATLAIRLKLAQDQLAIIQANEKAVTDAITAAIAAREALSRKNGDNEKKIAADSASARIAAIAPVLGAYQKLYGDLIALAQTEAAKVQGFELARVDIVTKVEAEIRRVRLEGLSGLDQFVAKNAEIDRLISEGRRKAAEGDTEAAKQFFDQAINESKTLTKVVDENGNVVITKTQATTAQLTALKKVQDAANESFGAQGASAKKGADAAIAEATRVGEKIKELQGQYDDLKKVAAEGLTLKVTTDEDSVAKALQTIAELTKPETKVITIKAVTEGGVDIPGFVGPPSPQSGGATGSFAKGGHVTLPNVRGFATGGPVFNPPGWDKVPGLGSGDTVPAALQAGSFVIRKAAVARYGDTPMGRIARFAIGGAVPASRHFPATPAADSASIPPLSRHSPQKRPSAYGEAIARYAFGGSVAPLYSFGTATSKQNQFVSFDPLVGNIYQNAQGKQVTSQSGTDQFVYAGDQKSGTTTVGPEISAADLPSDPKEKKRAILRYAFEVPPAAIQVDGFFYWKSWLAALDEDQKLYERSPTDSNLLQILRDARTIGLNIGITKREFQGFDVDGRKWHKTPGTASFAPHGLLGLGNTFDFYAKGGPIAHVTHGPTHSKVASYANTANAFYAKGGPSGADTVPAFLTPGEFVIKPSAVDAVSRMYGGGFLDAINQMKVEPDTLDRMMSPPPMPRYFAEGGRVNYAGDVSNVSNSNVTQSNARGGDTYELHFHGFDQTNEWIDRVLLPKLETKQRRSGTR